MAPEAAAALKRLVRQPPPGLLPPEEVAEASKKNSNNDFPSLGKICEYSIDREGAKAGDFSGLIDRPHVNAEFCLVRSVNQRACHKVPPGMNSGGAESLRRGDQVLQS